MSGQASQAKPSAAEAESMQKKDIVGTTTPDRDSSLIMISVVELNLRLPSMLHGKKGFERIVWAFTNVLTQSMAWLFHDLEDTSTTGEGHDTKTQVFHLSYLTNNAITENKPIQKLQPQLATCEPQEVIHEQILMPQLYGKALEEMPERDLQEYCGNLSEWFAMVQMVSPRISQNDDINPYLSRYAVPDVEQSRAIDLVSLKWHGLISCRWIMKLFLL